MMIRIGEIALLALCVAGFAACSPGKETPPDIKGAAGAAAGNESAANGASQGASGETAPGTAGAPSDGTAAGSAIDDDDTSTAATASKTAAPAEAPEPPPDPNAPTVRVFQVDGTDSVEVSVDARHMKQNLLFDDAQCKIFFEVGADADKMSAETSFPLGNFTVKETPRNKIFRHRLGADAVATSYSFTATESIAGTMQKRSAVTSTVIYKRPMGINIRTMLLSNQRIKMPTVTLPGKTVAVPAPAASVTTKTAVTSTKVNVTRQPAVTDTAKRPTRTGATIAPRLTPQSLPRVRER